VTLTNTSQDLDPIVSSATTQLQLLFERLAGAASASAVADFVRYGQDLGPFDHYKVFHQKARQLIPGTVLADGAKASEVFLKATIVQGMLDLLASKRFARLPPRVRAQQVKQLQRIAANDEIAGWLNVDNDLFHKEFGIATLRLYVAGAQLVDARCGIPRSILFKGGMRFVPKNIAAILRLGGFRKYFQLHTHKFMLDAFDEAGWSECYLCCAELYGLHPEVLGMFGSSWFYDPALAAISPRLSYLRATPMAGGAELFFVGDGESAKANALSTSPTRRKLYEEGKYSPNNYMLAWGKARQISWAKIR